MTIVDTPTAWTPFGWVVIMLLVQIGGVGIVALMYLGRIGPLTLSWPSRKTSRKAR